MEPAVEISKSNSSCKALVKNLRWTPGMLKVFVELRTHNTVIVKKLHDSKKKSWVRDGWTLLAQEFTRRLSRDDLWDGQVPRELNPAQLTSKWMKIMSRFREMKTELRATGNGNQADRGSKGPDSDEDESSEDEEGFAYTCKAEYADKLGDLAYVWSDLIAFTGNRNGLVGTIVEEFESQLIADDNNTNNKGSEIGGEDMKEDSELDNHRPPKKPKVEEDCNLISKVRNGGLKNNGAQAIADGVGGGLHAIAKAMEQRNEATNNNADLQKSSLAAINEGYASTTAAIEKLQSSISENFDRLAQTMTSFM